MAWIGTPGRLFEFKCPSAVEATTADTRVLFRSAMGRVSVTDTGDGPGPRSWAVAVEAARPQDVSLLQALAAGEFGPGPFAWVPPAAETLNLLGAGAAVCRGAHTQQPEVTSTTDPVLTAEGWAGRRLWRNTAPHVVAGWAPVVGGRAVAARVWCVGVGAQVRFVFHDAAGQPGATSTSIAIDAGAGAWVTHTATAPESAGIVRVDVLGAEYITRPSVTWDAPARVWGPSKAALSVSVAPIPESLLRATGRAGEETLARYAFEIQEVG